MEETTPTNNALIVYLLHAIHAGQPLERPTYGRLTIHEVSNEGTITKALFERGSGDAYEPAIEVSDCTFVHLTPGRRPAHTSPRRTRHDAHDGPIWPWESDYTSLVHVLWNAKRAGLTLQGDSDEIAALILRSRWLQALKAHTSTTNGTEQLARE